MTEAIVKEVARLGDIEHRIGASVLQRMEWVNPEAVDDYVPSPVEEQVGGLSHDPMSVEIGKKAAQAMTEHPEFNRFSRAA